jgi:acetyl esterase/lipase
MLVIRILLFALGAVALGLGLILTIYVDLPGLRTVWALFTTFAPIAIGLGAATAVGGAILILRRDPVGWALIGLGLGAAIMVLVQSPIVVSNTMVREWQAELDDAFGADWQSDIPEEISQHFLSDPVRGVGELPLAQPLREEVLAFATTADGEDLVLNVIRPDNDQTYPTVIYIHGGGWLDGGLGEGITLNRYLAAQGYVFVDVAYRYSKPEEGVENFYPVPLADIQCAIGYVSEHADTLGLDPDHMVLMGRSAGGTMALLTAYRGPGFVESTCETDGDYTVQGIVGLYSPIDTEVWVDHGKTNIAKMTTGYLGPLDAENIQGLYEASSPVHHVTSDAPPTLLIDGTRDLAVPPEQHDMMYEALQDAGIPAARLRTPWGTHGFDEGKPAGMSGQPVAWAVERFLAWRLYAP